MLSLILATLKYIFFVKVQAASVDRLDLLRLLFMGNRNGYGN